MGAGRAFGRTDRFSLENLTHEKVMVDVQCMKRQKRPYTTQSIADTEHVSQKDLGLQRLSFEAIK